MAWTLQHTHTAVAQLYKGVGGSLLHEKEFRSNHLAPTGARLHVTTHVLRSVSRFTIILLPLGGAVMNRFNHAPLRLSNASC